MAVGTEQRRPAWQKIILPGVRQTHNLVATTSMTAHRCN